MKIKRIEPIAVSLPLTKPVKMAGVELTAADNLVVRIESDDGVIGWGESASAAAVHLSAALPSNNWSLNISSPYLAEDLTAQPLAVVQGHVVVPDRPGLGIVADEARVRRFQRNI